MLSTLGTVLIILLAGGFAGFVNILAGGGSLLTLPLLIFLGLSPLTANATNRVAILVQNIVSIIAFKKGGVLKFGYVFFLAGSALLGALWGAEMGTRISDNLFQKILSLVMFLVLFILIWDPAKKLQMDDAVENSLPLKVLGVCVFFGVGVYGGFIQVGVGFVIIISLRLIHKMDLVQINSFKVTIVCVYTFAALYIYLDKVNWSYGLLLAVGNALGGWLGSHTAMKRGDQWIKRFLFLIVSCLAIRLLVTASW